MARVLITRRLPTGGLDPLLVAGHELIGPSPDDRAMSHGELCSAAADVDAVVCLLTDRIDDDVLRAGSPRLRVIANVAVGYDNIDLVAATQRGVLVCNTPGVLDETTADLAFLLILTASRAASEAEADLRMGRWSGWNINDHLGQDVHGRVLGIVGWGRIGQAVARRATGFGMTVLHHSRRPTGHPGYVASLDALLGQVDVASLHVPLNPASRHLLDARRIALLRPTAVLVNTSRGAIVDEAALADALIDGQLFAAGLDVYEQEPSIEPRLLRAPRTVLLPHIGSATVATRTAMARLAATSVVEALAGQVPTTVVAG